MFTLHDIDDQIAVFTMAADDLEAKASADPVNMLVAIALRGNAEGLRNAVLSLQRMIERAIEREARDALA